jgi:hypothetical protein
MKFVSAIAALFLLSGVVCFANAQDSQTIKIPSGIDPFRLKLLKKAEKLKVYVNMVGIGDAKDEKMLFPRAKGDAVGTHQQMNARFESAVKNTERFEAFSDTSGGVRDQSDLVVEGMVVAATQNIEDYEAIKKAVTTVRLDIKIKDTSTGLIMKARTLTGVYGDRKGEGTVIRSDTEFKARANDLAADYEKALQEVLVISAGYLERSIRPLGLVDEVEGDILTMIGGSNHGIRPNDQMVIFRAKTKKVGTVETFGIMRPVGIVLCDTVNSDSSQCQVKAKGKDWPPIKDDFAVLGDSSLKIAGE